MKGGGWMIVGLTGGIATGKSTISRALAELGMCVIDADVIARDVVAVGTEGLQELVAQFGREFLTPGGELDRAKLGNVIFADASSRERLNQIIHPRVRAEMWHRARHYVGEDPSRVAILDVPLLIEGGTHTVMDANVLVYAPVDVQLARLMARNGLSEAQARARIDAQWPIDQKRALVDVLVDNSGAIEQVSALAVRLMATLEAWAVSGPGGDGRFGPEHEVRPIVLA